MNLFIRLKNILFLKCPKCGKGDFLVGHPYNLSHFNNVKESCNHCNQKFRLEPSFYYGSMYVSYAIGVAIAVATFFLSLVLSFTESIFSKFMLISFVQIILMPYIGAVSKTIWAALFIKPNQRNPKND
jgi:uncharacterized protein (DUF983 family)